MSRTTKQKAAPQRRNKAAKKTVLRAQHTLSFGQYQSIVERTDERKQRIVSLLGLVGEVGGLNSIVKKLLLHKNHPMFRAELEEELGDILWYLTSLGALYKIPLQEVAESNAAKAMSLYSSGAKTSFDSDYDEDERLPRQFSVIFRETPMRNQVVVRTKIAGVVVGDTLTDNAREDDGYRFHDAFHLAFAAVLGWSPVLRRLLRRKRKSDPRVDEVEDGGRAAVVEEAISVFLFNQAEDRSWFKEESSIDLTLLKTIKKLTKKLEVHVCSAKQWKSAIYQGYEVFRELRKNRGGEVEVDLDARKISYQCLHTTEIQRA